jgi:hypothetical protein
MGPRGIHALITCRVERCPARSGVCFGVGGRLITPAQVMGRQRMNDRRLGAAGDPRSHAAPLCLSTPSANPRPPVVVTWQVFIDDTVPEFGDVQVGIMGRGRAGCNSRASRPNSASQCLLELT